MFKVTKKASKIYLIVACSLASPVVADDNGAQERSLSFSYGYCETIQSEVSKQLGEAPITIEAIMGQERAFSAGAFAARQDIILGKYNSLTAFNSVCQALINK